MFSILTVLWVHFDPQLGFRHLPRTSAQDLCLGPAQDRMITRNMLGRLPTIIRSSLRLPVPRLKFQRGVHGGSSKPPDAKASSLKQAEKWQLALALFDEMGRNGLERGAAMFKDVIFACTTAGQWKEAALVFEEMEKKGLERDQSTYHAVISSCGDAQQWEQAMRLFEDMGRKGLRRDTNSYNIIIKALGKAGKGKEAVKLFEEMGVHGIERDSVTFSSVLKACVDAGLTEQAGMLFEEMGKSRQQTLDVKKIQMPPQHMFDGSQKLGASEWATMVKGIQDFERGRGGSS